MPEKKKFKIGEVIVGNDKANGKYSITKKGWIGRVISEGRIDTTVIVKSLSSKSTFEVMSDCFDSSDSYAEGNARNIWEELKHKG
jgi:hypothetical protein